MKGRRSLRRFGLSATANEVEKCSDRDHDIRPPRIGGVRGTGQPAVAALFVLLVAACGSGAAPSTSATSVGTRYRRRSGGRALQGVVGLVVAAGSLVLAAPGAFAGISVLPGPAFTSPVSVGQTGVPATLTLTNNSTAPDNTGPVTIDAIRLVPSCGTATPTAGDCPAGSEDPGVFQLSPTGLGRAGTACHLPFSINPVAGSTTGEYDFVPAQPILLEAPGSPNSTCVIDFTFDVLKPPAKPIAGQPPDTTAQIARTVFGPGSSTLTFGVSTTQVAPVVGSPLVSPILGGMASVVALVVGGLFLFRRRRPATSI